jgi:hypothetical protein
VKLYHYDVPSHVATCEAAALYEFMARGKTEKREYLDRRNQCLFDSLEHLIQMLGRIGTQELVSYLSDQELLNTAGGLSYVQKVFNHLEPLETNFK